MEEKIVHYKEILIHKAYALIEEIEKDMQDFRKKYREKYHRDHGYTLQENIATFEGEIEAVQDFKKIVNGIKIAEIEAVEEFREIVISELQTMYNDITRLRAGIRMVIECIKSTMM